MIVSGQLAALDGCCDRTRPGLWRAINERADARVNECSHAHQAWLDRDRKRGAGEPIVAERSRSQSDGDDFGMRRWVAGTDGLIETSAHDLAVDRNDGADRNFAGGEREPRLLERSFHQEFIVHEAYELTPRGLRRAFCVRL